MGIILDIRRLVRHLYQAFGDAALWCWAHDPPFGWLGDFFLECYNELTDLYYELYQFARDYDDLWEWVTEVLTESDIFRLLQTWLNYAEDAWSWVLNSPLYIGSIVNDWWLEKQAKVEGWIAIAVDGLAELLTAWDSFWTVSFPNWTSKLGDLKASWDNFWTVTFPTLVSFSWLGIWWDSRLVDIQSLINTAIANLGTALEDWLEIRDQVLEFFADPWAWLYERLEDFMDRYW